AEAENRCARGREYVEYLKLRRVRVIATRHSEITGDKLRQERQVESDEDHEGTKPAPSFRIHAPADLWPPIVQTAEISHQRAADHDVVEVCDDEIRVAQMHIDCERRQEQSRHAADGE